jgi:hypothetical protein
VLENTWTNFQNLTNFQNFPRLSKTSTNPDYNLWHQQRRREKMAGHKRKFPGKFRTPLFSLSFIDIIHETYLIQFLTPSNAAKWCLIVLSCSSCTHHLLPSANSHVQWRNVIDVASVGRNKRRRYQRYQRRPMTLWATLGVNLPMRGISFICCGWVNI